MKELFRPFRAAVMLDPSTQGGAPCGRCALGWFVVAPAGRCGGRQWTVVALHDEVAVESIPP